MDIIFYQVGVMLWKILFILVPGLLVVFFAHAWITYKQKEFISKIDWALLEIKVPRDVHKSPEAMEIVLHALLDVGGTGNWYVRWWKGQVRLWSSLEIVSIEGTIYFFIRLHRKHKDSQYPQAEVQEVDDYIRYVPPYSKSNEWSMYGAEFNLTKADGYPIKTYVDYGMDRALSLDEEQRIDPITPFLEFLSTMRSGEQVWFQIIIRAAANKPIASTLGFLWQFKKGDTWVDQAKADIKKFLEDNASNKKDEKGNKIVDLALLTPRKKDVLAALERSITKPGFETGIRMLYMAPKDKFRGTNIGGLLALFRHYSTSDLNGFGIRNTPDFDLPWQDINNKKTEKNKEDLFNDYVTRTFFYYPSKSTSGTPFILNTEELATIFHFPSRTAETPSFERIGSRKSEAPSNLPF